jgi:ketosteroid isomerase-like protein
MTRKATTNTYRQRAADPAVLLDVTGLEIDWLRRAVPRGDELWCPSGTTLGGTVADLDEFRDQYHKSVEAFIQGDPEVQKPLWSAGEDVTLANPLGPPVRGFRAVCEHMDRAASLISGGQNYTFHSISVVEADQLAYEVGIESNMVKLGDATDHVPVSLRVTTVFRLEDGKWKIAHRHADTITEERSVQSLAQPAQGAS